MTTSAEMFALSRIAEMQSALDDSEYCRRLANAVSAAMSFCIEPETWPVFHRWFIASVDNPEQAEALSKLKREDFEYLILFAAARIDPAGLLELIREELQSPRIKVESSGK